MIIPLLFRLDPPPIGLEVYFVGSHRAAPVRAERRPQRPTGKRAGTRKSLFRGLPSIPAMLGVAVLAASAGGAVTMGQATLASATTDSMAHAANAAGGHSTSGTVNLLARGPVASRSEIRTVAEPLSAAGTQAEALLKKRNASLLQMQKAAQAQAKLIRLNLWVLPVVGYQLTAGFGQVSYLWAHVHTGQDFACPTGTPIHAVANGVITFVGWDGSYGNKTVETLDDGTEIWYAHQSAQYVSVGQTVHSDDVIGAVGATGNVTGPHLHLEVRPGGGDPVDPMPVLREHGLNP